MKADRGKTTNFGLSLRYLELANLDLNSDGLINIEDVLKLNIDKAREVYKKNWWSNLRLSEIKNESVAIIFFDSIVWLGEGQAVKIIQNSINGIIVPTIKVDGILGTETISGLNFLIIAGMSKEFVKVFQENLKSHIFGIIDKDESQTVFKQGWLNRINSYEKVFKIG